MSVQTPFSQCTAESAINSTIISEKVQFPKEKVTLLQVLGKLYVTLLYFVIYYCWQETEGHFGVVWKAKAKDIVQKCPHITSLLSRQQWVNTLLITEMHLFFADI